MKVTASDRRRLQEVTMEYEQARLSIILIHSTPASADRTDRASLPLMASRSARIGVGSVSVDNPASRRPA